MYLNARMVVGLVVLFKFFACKNAMDFEMWKLKLWLS